MALPKHVRERAAANIAARQREVARYERPSRDTLPAAESLQSGHLNGKTIRASDNRRIVTERMPSAWLTAK